MIADGEEQCAAGAEESGDVILIIREAGGGHVNLDAAANPPPWTRAARAFAAEKTFGEGRGEGLFAGIGLAVHVLKETVGGAAGSAYILLAGVNQRINTQFIGRRTHFLGYRGVFGGRIGVIGPAVPHGEGKTGGGEVGGNRLRTRFPGMGEIDGDSPPHGAFGLVHQAAGLAEVAVFGFLTDKGRFQRIESVFIRCGRRAGRVRRRHRERVRRCFRFRK